MNNSFSVTNIDLLADPSAEGKLSIRGDIQNISDRNFNTVFLRILIRNGTEAEPLAGIDITVHGLSRGLSRSFDQKLSFGLPKAFRPAFTWEIISSY